MELNKLNGNIIGIISNMKDSKEYKGLVKDIITKKTNESLKMVGLDIDILEKEFNNLSINNKNKVILASKLHDNPIILYNFSLGLTKKEIEFYKLLFKKIINYGKKIILIDKNTYLFLNLVDNIYVIDKDQIIYNTNALYDKTLEKYISNYPLVNFILNSKEYGIKLNEYQEFDELLKAIYRIKS